MKNIIAAIGTMGSEKTDTAGRPLIHLDIDKLYSEYKPPLLNFVKRYVRDAEDAEDVVRNTFIQAVRCTDSFSGVFNPSAWLFGIALTVAREQKKRNYADIHIAHAVPGTQKILYKTRAWKQRTKFAYPTTGANHFFRHSTLPLIWPTGQLSAIPNGNNFKFVKESENQKTNVK